jgi:hypothetical protein
MAALAWAGAATWLRQHRPRRRLAVGLLIGSLALAPAVGFGVLSAQRNALWGSAYALWDDSAAKSPVKPRPFGNLAVAALRQGDALEAIALARYAVDLDAAYGQARVTLLDAALVLDAEAAALAAMEEALIETPAHALDWYLRRRGQLREEPWRALFAELQTRLWSSLPADTLVALGLYQLHVRADRDAAIELLQTAWQRRKQLRHFRRKALRRLLRQR